MLALLEEGAVLRDSLSQLIFVSATPYHNATSSLQAEALTLRDGLSLCRDQGILAVEVKIDSLVVE